MTDATIIEKSLPSGWQRWRNVGRPFKVALARINPRTTFFNLLLAFFFFLLPLQSRYLLREVPLYEYGTLSVFLVEIFGWVVIAFCLPGTWEHGNMGTKLKKGFLVSLFPCFLIIWAFLSIVWAPDKLVALQVAVRLLEGVLLYVVVAQTFRSESGRSKDLRYMLWWSFIMGATIQAVLGIQQFLTQSTFASTWLGLAFHDPRALGTSVVELADERWLRAYGGLPHPNVLGGYLVVALVIAIEWLQRLQMHQRFQRLGLKVVTPILLTGIFFSFSRAAWVAALIVMVYWACSARIYPRRSDLKRAHYIALGMTILYVALLVVVYRPLVLARLTPESSGRLETKSRVERVEGVQEAWQMVRAHPIFGVGIGNYTQSVRRELRPSQPLYSYQPVHNVPLLIWTELGLVGLALFAGVLYFIVKQSRPAVLLSCCFAVLLLADHYLWTLPFGILLFWAVMGVAQGFSPEKSGLKA